MTDIAVIKSIKASGGWCQLYYSNIIPFGHIMGGRLLLFVPDFSLIEKFDLNTDSLKGYFIIVNITKQRLIKAYWIKQILTIGGKTVSDPGIPTACTSNNLPDLLSNLKISREIVIIKTRENEICGRLSDLSDNTLTIESKNHTSACIILPLSGIISLEWQTYRIQHLSNV